MYLVKVNCKMHIFYESNIFSCMYFNFIAIYNSPVPQSNNNNNNSISILKHRKNKTQNAKRNKKRKPKTDCKLIPTECRTQSTAYLQEMAQLAKRAQTIIVHSHGQHGKDHHGNQYSPSVAQLQQRHDLANESYREVRSPSDGQQHQDGKCVIPVFQL